jgi:1,2-diacylglycerol 3-alpha-glucosyltransferase
VKKSTGVRRLCVQWPRFGPYHIARLNATAEYVSQFGVEIIGLETAESDATYEWQIQAGDCGFRREQVFAGKRFDDLTPRHIHRGVTQALDRLDPDAVAINSYSFPDARACLEWCRRNKRIAVVITDSKEDDSPRVWLRERLKASIIKEFDAALLAGTPHEAYFRGLGFPPHRIRLGCDVVDNDYFAVASDRVRTNGTDLGHLPGLGLGNPFFLTVTRLLAIKNVDGLIAAYAAYRRKVSTPWSLVIVGDGPEREALEQAASGIGGVFFAGFRQIDELPAYYGLASAFVLPSHKDTWGLVVNEAMASGLPVLVSSRAGCARDLVKEGENGYSFDPTATTRLTKLLVDVSSSANLRQMGMRSIEIISEWPLDLFARSLWSAVEIGKETSDRGISISAGMILVSLRLLSRSSRSFHSVAD